MYWSSYRPYVSVAARRAKAAKHTQKLAAKGTKLAPVRIEGRTIAHTFWGKAWCEHLESFSDYENRLPRGRSYVRNGSVLDLQVAAGKISAMIMGSSLYHGTITVAPLKPAQWQAIKAECAGKIDSLVGLLQGRLSDAVLRVITNRENGLFPKPAEIKLGCSCPDSASLCKHLAAVLYGVGARLDTQPELLFLLRGVDHLELISAAADAAALAPAGETGAVDEGDLSEVFGIEIEPAAIPARPKVEAAGRTKTKGKAKTHKVEPPEPAAISRKAQAVPKKRAKTGHKSTPKPAKKFARRKEE